jgi:hypothetical protein
MSVKNVLIGFLILLLLLIGYTIQAGVAVIHVRTPEARFWFPVPVALGHLVGGLINLPPLERPELESILEYREVAAEVLRQLQSLPDSNFVEVSKANEHVRIFKRADSLYVHVETPDERVSVRLPLHIARSLIETLNSQRINLGDLIACLEWQPSGDLVHVKTGQEEVRISIW